MITAEQYIAYLLSTPTNHTCTNLAEHLDGVSHEVAAARPVLERGIRADVSPLSYSQERIWLLEKISGHPFDMLCLVRIQGELDDTIVQRCFDDILERHEALRTIFPVVDGHPVQKVLPPRPWPIEIIDLRHLGAAERIKQLQELIKQEATHPFNCEQDLMVAATIVHLQPRDHVLLLVIDHLVTDGLSFGLCLNEFGDRFAAYAGEAPLPVTPLPIQYADFATWQRAWFEGATLAAERRYWRHHLHGLPEFLHLPYDRPRPPRYEVKGARQTIAIDEALVQQVHRTARRHGVTAFMVWLAAFSMTIAELTEDHDFGLMIPTATRPTVATEALIGLFADVLPLRLHVKPGTPPTAVIAHVQAECLAMYAHRDMPSREIRRALEYSESADVNWERVLFSMNDFPFDTMQAGPITLTRMSLDDRRSQFDLHIRIEERAAGTVVTAIYSTARFDPATIQGIMDLYKQHIEGICG